MMHLIKGTPFITANVVGMNRACRRIAERRQEEANTLPALPTEEPASPRQSRHKSLVKQALILALMIIHLVAGLVAFFFEYKNRHP